MLSLNHAGAFFYMTGVRKTGNAPSYSQEDLEAATMRMRAIMEAQMAKKG